MTETTMAYRPALVAPGHENMLRQAIVLAQAVGRGAAQGVIGAPKGAMALTAAARDGKRLYPIHQGIAVIGVSGMLVDKFPYIGWGFVTGYDALRCQFEQAFADPEVRAIALDIDSGGGMVAGCFDLVDWIAATKRPAGKPVAAILTESAYSAAYAIASAADRIAVPRTGGVGSIGVVMMHVDMSGLLEQWGVDVTLIQSGKHKTDGHPFAPLPADVQATFQAECDELRDLFAATVARNRADAGLTAKAAMKTEARIFTGPGQLAEAVRIGLADEVMPARQAFARLVREINAQAT